MEGNREEFPEPANQKAESFLLLSLLTVQFLPLPLKLLLTFYERMSDRED